MKLEKQVSSLELSKRLQELGVKQDSFWKWTSNDDGKTMICWPLTFLNDDEYSAFTTAELSEMLPENIHIFMLKVKDVTPTWFCEAGECNGEATNWEQTSDIVQANAIAKMLIYLLENGLIK